MQESGYAVLVAANGREALALSRAFSGEIQLLMSDINMPHMDGLDLASHVINDRPGTRVLMLSGLDQDTLGLPFLRKPFVPRELWRMLELVFSTPSPRLPAAPRANAA